MGWSDGFDLWNCVLLQNWVCVYTGMPICGALEWLWWGSTPQCPERIDLQYGGQLGKHMYSLAKGLVEFRFLCHLGTLETIFHDPSVHGSYKVGLLLLFDLITTEHLCFRSPSAF